MQSVNGIAEGMSYPQNHTFKMQHFLSPRTKWTILRILPFGIIYLVTTWVFLMVELSVHQASESNNYFVISLNLPAVVFVTFATFLVGVLVGAVEMVWLRSLFKNRPLLQKIIYKLLIYIGGSFSIIVLLFPVAMTVEFGLAPWHEDVVSKLAEFLLNISFYSTLLQMAFTILLCLIYGAISDNLGHDVLTNFFTGKYHQPTVEQRIFMFLDMKDSTTLAEQLGHVQYFKLLSAYYDTFSNSIIDHRGEVYQYIGDEIVISWPMELGVARANCIRCFFAMQEALEDRHEQFQKQFGVNPKFKAGLHAGQVTTGEIGDLKKEIAFSGDVLNVTARIQGLCNEYRADLLISGSLLGLLDLCDAFKTRHLGQRLLKGRDEPVEVYNVSHKGHS